MKKLAAKRALILTKGCWSFKDQVMQEPGSRLRRDQTGIEGGGKGAIDSRALATVSGSGDAFGIVLLDGDGIDRAFVLLHRRDHHLHPFRDGPHSHLMRREESSRKAHQKVGCDLVLVARTCPSAPPEINRLQSFEGQIAVTPLSGTIPPEELPTPVSLCASLIT